MSTDLLCVKLKLLLLYWQENKRAFLEKSARGNYSPNYADELIYYYFTGAKTL